MTVSSTATEGRTLVTLRGEDRVGEGEHRLLVMPPDLCAAQKMVVSEAA